MNFPYFELTPVSETGKTVTLLAEACHGPRTPSSKPPFKNPLVTHVVGIGVVLEVVDGRVTAEEKVTIVENDTEALL